MMILKTKALVIGLMVAGGVAAPIATHYATQPADRPIVAKTDLVPETELPTVAAIAPAPAPEVVLTELTVAPTPKPAPVAALVPAPTPEAKPEKKCVRRQLESVGSGGVVICDIERTQTGKTGGVFAPIDKPEQLAPRDVPSPSGFVR